MPERDHYIPGVPCWVDTNQPDPVAAVAFYRGLFGWDVEDGMPPGSDSHYFMGRVRGGAVAAISSVPEGEPTPTTWNTYVAVASADDAAAAARAAGGTVVAEPFDVNDAGRMAIVADPEGAVLCLWEAGRVAGATVVNEHGALNFNGLATRDVDGARAFYGAVFGWTMIDLGGGSLMWALPGYADDLEKDDPGFRKVLAESGAPAGFEDVVAAVTPIADDDHDTPPHWSVTFGVDDVDAIATRAADLGATVLAPPFDVPWSRMTVLRDPQGATFIASQYVPENKDIGA